MVISYCQLTSESTCIVFRCSLLSDIVSGEGSDNAYHQTEPTRNAYTMYQVPSITHSFNLPPPTNTTHIHPLIHKQTDSHSYGKPSITTKPISLAQFLLANFTTGDTLSSLPRNERERRKTMVVKKDVEGDGSDGWGLDRGWREGLREGFVGGSWVWM
jgi:hypothetical protein